MKVLHKTPNKLVVLTEAEGERASALLVQLGYVRIGRDIWTPDQQQCIADKDVVGTVVGGHEVTKETEWHFEPDHLVKIIPQLWAEIDRLRRLTHTT